MPAADLVQVLDNRQDRVVRLDLDAVPQAVAVLVHKLDADGFAFVEVDAHPLGGVRRAVPSLQVAKQDLPVVVFRLLQRAAF